MNRLFIVRRALEVVQQRLVLPVADGGIDPQPDSLECDPRMVLAWRSKRLRGRSAHVFRNLQKMQMEGALLVLAQRAVRLGVDTANFCASFDTPLQT